MDLIANLAKLNIVLKIEINEAQILSFDQLVNQQIFKLIIDVKQVVFNDVWANVVIAFNYISTMKICFIISAIKLVHFLALNS
jgi:hypothetical protein